MTIVYVFLTIVSKIDVLNKNNLENRKKKLASELTNSKSNKPGLERYL